MDKKIRNIAPLTKLQGADLKDERIRNVISYLAKKNIVACKTAYVQQGLKERVFIVVDTQAGQKEGERCPIIGQIVQKGTLLILLGILDLAWGLHYIRVLTI